MVIGTPLLVQARIRSDGSKLLNVPLCSGYTVNDEGFPNTLRNSVGYVLGRLSLTRTAALWLPGCSCYPVRCLDTVEWPLH